MENTKTNAVRIIIFCVFIAAIVVIMSMIVGGTDTSSKFNSFAQCITAKKLKFYGAFWCPHCQAQKAAFGEGAEYLPYIECSNADRSQNQTCIDAKVESYPTWVYPTPITYTSSDAPIVCPVQPGPAGQPADCADDGSHYFKTWIFPGLKMESTDDPVQAGNTWTFEAGSRSVGEQDTTQGMQNLSNFSGCALPTDTASSTS